MADPMALRYTEAQFKCDVPSHAQNDDLLVKVPSLEQILCRGRFRHPGSYRRILTLSTVCTRTPLVCCSALPERSEFAGGLDGVGRYAEVEASEIEEGAVAFMQDGEFDLRGLQLGGDGEWASLEHALRQHNPDNHNHECQTKQGSTADR
jgi:hypothetical protein